MNKVIVSMLILATSACAFTPQDATINTNVNITESAVGANTFIAVKVHDERTSTTLGNRGTATGAGAKITSSQDIADLFETSLRDAFSKKGFLLNDNSNSNEPINIRVDLRSFDYSTSTGFWTGGIHTTAAAKVSLTGSDFESMYMVEDEKRVVFVPGGKANEKLLSETLSQLVEKIVNDQKLTQTILEQKKTSYMLRH